MTLRLLGGLDPTGGAGITRDLATAFTLNPRLVFRRGAAESGGGEHFEVLRAAITATTVQGASLTPRTIDVHEAAVKEVLLDASPGLVGASADGVKAAIQDVTKIGLVPDALAPTLASSLRILRAREAAGSAAETRVVVDPVLGATAGGDLGVSPEASAGWLGLADLVTPNLHEALRLLDVLEQRPAVSTRPQTSSARDSSSEEALPDLALRLARALAATSSRGCVWVLLKGGHAATSALVRDVLASSAGTVEVFDRERWPGPEIRGTGCALATAIATYWHAGGSVVEATCAGIEWLDQARRDAVEPDVDATDSTRESHLGDAMGAPDSRHATRSFLRVDADVRVRLASALAACIDEATRPRA